MVVLACNPALGRLRQEDYKFQATLGYTARLYIKKQNKAKKNPF
jgi:hypothetical protein